MRGGKRFEINYAGITEPNSAEEGSREKLACALCELDCKVV